MESKKIKVAYFIGSLNRGGAEMLTLDILRKRDSAPFEMILVYRNEGELSHEFRGTGVTMYRVKPRGIKLDYVGKIRKLLKNEKVDVLHAQTLPNGVIGIISTLFLKTKVVTTFHGLMNSFLKTVLRHLVIWWSDETIFVSEYVRKWYLQHTLFCNKEKCNVVYNGVCVEKFDSFYPEPEVLENANDRLKFGCVGNFVAERTQIVICQSIKRLVDSGEQHFDFFFIGKRIDGEGKCYDDCVRYCDENHLTDHVHFLGSRGDVVAILQHLDGFVYSTGRDTFGIAVVEALMSGVPVVVNDWDVMKEITCQGKYATLFETENDEDCAMKIKELVASNEAYHNKALKNVEEIREMYSIEKHVMNLYEIYKTLSK